MQFVGRSIIFGKATFLEWCELTNVAAVPESAPASAIHTNSVLFMIACFSDYASLVPSCRVDAGLVLDQDMIADVKGYEGPSVFIVGFSLSHVSMRQSAFPILS